MLLFDLARKRALVTGPAKASGSRSPQAVEQGIQDIENRVGNIEILVNNAGVQYRQSLEDFPDHEWNRLIATNLSSAFFVSRAVVKGMIGRRSGKIINIASVQAELGR